MQFVALSLILTFVHGNIPHRPFLSDGEWETYIQDILIAPGPCNIDIVDKRLSQRDFLSKYAYSAPFILRDASDNTLIRALSRKSRLLLDWGHTKIRLSSANSYSYDKIDVPFSHYVSNMMKPQKISSYANETFYFFGDNDVIEWKEFLDEYKLPPLWLPNHKSALSFGLAGPGTGVPFHFHGPGFSETLIGRKRWFLTSPETKPEFHPNKTTLQWYLEDYPTLSQKINIYECTIRPGEVIYFPDKWWHATLNIDTSVFMSTFLSP